MTVFKNVYKKRLFNIEQTVYNILKILIKYYRFTIFRFSKKTFYIIKCSAKVLKLSFKLFSFCWNGFRDLMHNKVRYRYLPGVLSRYHIYYINT